MAECASGGGENVGHGIHCWAEPIALANDCQLTNDGDVTLDSKECVEAADFYGNLIRNYAAAGNQDADTTRASYFAGRAAMVIWSTFMLDELAGLRNDALPNCPECAASLTFLVENTGVVQALQGPSGDEPAAFGEVVSWAILQDAAPETTELVEYLMSDGYEDWLGIAPEGKIPVRHGTEDDPEAYVTAWKELAPVSTPRHPCRGSTTPPGWSPSSPGPTHSTGGG